MILFPVYNSLGSDKSTAKVMKAVSIGSGLGSVIYVIMGILSIYTFGEGLMISVLDNLNKVDNAYSYTIRIAFLIVLACHIPYVFFPGKESLLIIFDEAKN